MLRSASFLKIGYIGLVSVPVASYIIITIKQYGVAPGLSLPPAMLFLFLGSLLLSIAHFLNEILCPEVIRRYRSFDEYRASVASSILHYETILQAYTRHYRAQYVEKITEHLEDLDPRSINALADTISTVNADIAREREAKQLPIGNDRTIWERDNLSMRLQRYFIAILYGVSGIIAAGLVARHIFVVLRAAFA